MGGEQARTGVGGEVDDGVECVPPVASGSRIAEGRLDHNERHREPPSLVHESAVARMPSATDTGPCRAGYRCVGEVA